MEKQDRYAVLIDADNISSRYADAIFNEIATNYGEAPIRKIYGDWDGHKNGWDKDVLIRHSLEPVQQFAYVTGKNATDIRMVIDAMDILYTKDVDGFVLVSSDSDYTYLATRLKQENKNIVGMGVENSAKSFRLACNKFVFLNRIDAHEDDEPPKDAGKRQQPQRQRGDAVESPDDVTPIETICEILISLVLESDARKVIMSRAGLMLNNLVNDYDPRNYGYSKLKTLVRNEIPELRVVTENDQDYLVPSSFCSYPVAAQAVLDYMESVGGEVDNISKITGMLKERFKGFTLKSIGFSKTSNFLKTIDGLDVKDNIARLVL